MKKWFVCLMMVAMAAGLAAQDKPYTFSDKDVGTLVITSTTVDAVWPKAVRLFMTQDRDWVVPPITVTDKPSGLLVGVWAQGKGLIAWSLTLSLSFEQDGPDVRISAVPSVLGSKHPSRRKKALAVASFFDALLEAMK